MHTLALPHQLSVNVDNSGPRTISTCPSAKVEGSLQSLHKMENNACSWLVKWLRVAVFIYFEWWFMCIESIQGYLLDVQKNACEMAAGQRSFMSSVQCLETTAGLITPDLCLPPASEILRFDTSSLDCHTILCIYFSSDNIVL